MKADFDYKELISILRSYKNEEGWFEFKVGNTNPEVIGVNVSSLGNTASLSGHPFGYMVWGVSDDTHEIVGTSFSPSSTKVGNQELVAWLSVKTSPRVDVNFKELFIEDKKVVLMQVPAAVSSPIRFDKEEYVRIGSNNHRLSDYPDIERRLWQHFDKLSPERRVVLDGLALSAIPEYLALDAYFIIQGLPIPSTIEVQISNFKAEGFILKNDDGSFSITALGALLFARNLRMFHMLASKALRVIRYKAKSRVEAINDITFTEGYALCFEQACSSVETMLPVQEEIGSGLRKEIRKYPSSAIREVIGNMLIHQDLSVNGSGPILEVFEDSIEGSNPGSLLVPRDRIIDAPPRARNESMAAFLRRVHICEERGSGFDRMEKGMAEYSLPSPMVETGEGFTRIKLLWYSNFSKWKKEEKLWTCYLSVCLDYVSSISVSNTVLRERFGVEERNSAIISRLAKEAVDAGLIKIADISKGAKSRRYLPYWA